MYKVLIGISSNIYSKYNIDRAKRMIKYTFHDVLFSKTVITISDDERFSFPFRNKLALLHTDMPLVELNSKLKSIESAIGKRPRDKDHGRVIINIELLKYDNVVLRNEDLEKEYIVELMKDFDNIETESDSEIE